MMKESQLLRLVGQMPYLVAGLMKTNFDTLLMIKTNQRGIKSPMNNLMNYHFVCVCVCVCVCFAFEIKQE